MGLDESQAEIKIARRNINNLRYTDDTTLMAESEEELKSLMMNVNRESEKAGLKLNIQKPRIMASSPIISWQIDRDKMEAVTDFIYLGSKITADGDSLQFSSAQFICSVMSDSLQAHESQHARPPCPSPTLGVH